MAVLAREADRKWEAKERLLDMPLAATPAADTEPVQAQRTSTTVETNATAGAQEEQSEPDASSSLPPARTTTTADRGAATEGAGKGEKDDTSNPWKQASRAGPSEEWQPQAWSPAPARRR